MNRQKQANQGDNFTIKKRFYYLSFLNMQILERMLTAYATILVG